MRENDFECLASTGVNTPGTMFSSSSSALPLTCDPFIPGPARMLPIYRTRVSNSHGLKERESPWRRIKGSDNGNLQPERRKLARHANYINNLYRSSEVINGTPRGGARNSPGGLKKSVVDHNANVRLSCLRRDPHGDKKLAREKIGE
jgi:hypothetical protein